MIYIYYTFQRKTKQILKNRKIYKNTKNKRTDEQPDKDRRLMFRAAGADLFSIEDIYALFLLFIPDLEKLRKATGTDVVLAYVLRTIKRKSKTDAMHVKEKKRSVFAYFAPLRANKQTGYPPPIHRHKLRILPPFIFFYFLFFHFDAD